MAENTEHDLYRALHDIDRIGFHRVLRAPGRLPTVAVVSAFAVVAWFALAFRRVASFFRGAFPHVVRRKSLLRKGANRPQLLQQLRIEILPKEG